MRASALRLRHRRHPRAGHDPVKRFLRRYPSERKMRLIGPNCAGIITPRQGLHGHHAAAHLHAGPRRHRRPLRHAGLRGRQPDEGARASACRPASASAATRSTARRFRDILELFEDDPETDAVMMIGEIGGPQEAEAGDLRPRSHDEAGRRLYRRSVGAQGPQDGPCRARSSRAFGESAQEKVEILSAAGITIAPNPSAMGETMARVLSGRARQPDLVSSQLHRAASGPPLFLGLTTSSWPKYPKSALATPRRQANFSAMIPAMISKTPDHPPQVDRIAEQEHRQIAVPTAPIPTQTA